MRVLIVSINQEKRFNAITPLGAGYIAAAVQSAGHEAKLLDLCFEDNIELAIQHQITMWPPEVIGISVRNLDSTLYLAPFSFIPSLQTVVKVCRLYSNAPIVLGGAGFSIMPEAILRACGVSFGIVGEGEVTFLHLLKTLQNGHEMDSVPGLAWIEEDSYRQNPPQWIWDLDMLTVPARELYDSRYQESPTIGNVQTKRGCRFNCIYCTYPLIEGRVLRLRSPQKIAEEIGLLESTGCLTRIDLVDSVFNDPEEHALAICHALIRNNNTLSWGCSIRPDNMSSELADAMVNAGCRWVDLGIDAASNKMLRVLKKGFDVDTIHQAVSLLKKVGIEVTCYIIVGGPGENNQSLLETLTNLEALDPTWAYIMPGLRVYPGTDLAKIVQANVNEAALIEPYFYFSPEIEDPDMSLLFSRVETHSNWIVLGKRRAKSAGLQTHNH
jgi:radical SAM superfamily enzyme YgiQ (UPF0313 family)